MKSQNELSPSPLGVSADRNPKSTESSFSPNLRHTPLSVSPRPNLPVSFLMNIPAGLDPKFFGKTTGRAIFASQQELKGVELNLFVRKEPSWLGMNRGETSTTSSPSRVVVSRVTQLPKLYKARLRSSSLVPVPIRLGSTNVETLNAQIVSSGSSNFETLQQPTGASAALATHRRKFVPSRVKNWICYGKRTSLQSNEKADNKTSVNEEDSPWTKPNEVLPPHILVDIQVQKLFYEPLLAEIQMPKMIYDQQNMIKCFEERNFYRLLFAFFQSLCNSFGNTIDTNTVENQIPEKDLADNKGKPYGEFPFTKGTVGTLVDVTKLEESNSSLGQVVTRDHLKNWGRPLLYSLAEHHWDEEYTRWRARKFILFARSEMKRLFRKVLFMKSESLLFAQIFLIPLAAFFGILYTFWTFSVSATATSKEYIPIAQQRQISKLSKFKTAYERVSENGRNSGTTERASRVYHLAKTRPDPMTKSLGVLGTSESGHGVTTIGHETPWFSALRFPKMDVWARRSQVTQFLKGLMSPEATEGTGEQSVDNFRGYQQKIQENWPQLSRRTSRKVLFQTEEPTLPIDCSAEDFIEFEEQQSMKFTPFFTSYKVDWSPTRGLADFLRFTNSASKIFMLWASLAVLRSLRPAKANRPELQIQTRFLRPFQNRKRFRDLEGIEKFAGVLGTLTESLQGSFKDPLFYIALILPNLPFFQPFQKGIGKFRFFLFYGKQTAFLRKTISAFLNIFLPEERQRQAQSFPKGYLFIGPPGTGKTLLAQAIAGESKVNFICLSASEIQKQVDIGTRIGALRLRNLFEEARTSTPCILFFDEIDTLGRARLDGPSNQRSSFHSQQKRAFGKAAHEMGSPRSIWENSTKKQSGKPQKNLTQQAMNGVQQEIDLKLFTEFLVQMDSFSVKDGFLVIGTTNFLSSLDPAFVRSGRFDRILGLSYPPKQTRIAILKLHIHKKGNFFESKLPWNIFGLKTKDLSPADLAKIVNESSLYLVNQLNSLKPKSTRPDHEVTEGPLVLLAASTQGSVLRSGARKVIADKKGSGFSSALPLVVNSLRLFLHMTKSFFDYKPGLTHTSQSLREGFVKILESKK